jgi:hypothetical protein
MFRDAPRQQFRLIEPALQLTAPVKRNRHDGIESLVHRHRALQIPGERPRQRFHSGILEQVNETAQRPFINAETGRLIKAAQPRPASGTNALLIERPGIEERCVTNRAEVIGLKRRRRMKAAFADGNPRPFIERAITNAAIVRKN